MTRQQILDEYDVDANGIIRDPGKFEGEMLYVPYFWDAFLNGMADEDEGEVLTFEVDDTDREQFPELAGIITIDLIETGDGFVVCTGR